MELTSLGAIIGFGYTSASAWRLAHRAGSRTFAVTGAAGTLISAAFAVVKLIPGLAALETMGAVAFLLLSLWCLMGFLFYLRTVVRSRALARNGTSTAGVVMYALLLYSALLWLGKRLAAANSVQDVRATLQMEGAPMLVVVFIGLGVMMYIQHLAQREHDELRAKGEERRGSGE